VDCCSKLYHLSRGKEVMLISIGSHSHPRPPPQKVTKEQVEKVKDAFTNHITLNSSDVRKEKGLDAVPWLLNPTLINLDKISNYKKQVI
jgi:hypothetical protein